MGTTVKKDKAPVHLGNNAQRIREIMEITQDTLAQECGWTRQYLSKLENSQYIDDDHLKTIAEKLGVTNEFIRNFNEERAIFNIQHDITVSENASNLNGHQPTYNNNHPIDPLIELFEKFIRDDQKKTQTIEEIGKAVIGLAEEIKELKNRKT